MTPEQASDLAERTLAAIDRQVGRWRDEWLVADRERVASDLSVIRHAHDDDGPRAALGFALLRRYASENLRRTAALYGVEVTP